MVTQDRQLPVVVHLASANRHDSVLSLYTTEETYERNFSIQYASFDSASDAYGIYELGIKRWDVGLVIPLNETNSGNYTYSPPIEINASGVPIGRERALSAFNVKRSWRWSIGAFVESDAELNGDAQLKQVRSIRILLVLLPTHAVIPNMDE